MSRSLSSLLPSAPLLVFAALFGASLASAQSCRLVADFSPGTGAGNPNRLHCFFGDRLFLSAAGGGVGQEPYVSKAGGKPVLLKDIRAGGVGSFPKDFVACGSLVFFSADDGKVGRELWVTDGSPAGTRLVKDIRAKGRLGSDIRDIACLGNKVVFRADGGVAGPELWISDGTTAGTRLLKDIRLGARGSDPSWLRALNGRVLFSADDGVAGRELWMTDGTTNGTQLLKDINTGVNASSPNELFVHRGTLFFGARPGRTGTELFQSDGTRKGTVLVKDLNTSGSSLPRQFTSCGTKLFFIANNAALAGELYVRDANGIRPVVNNVANRTFTAAGHLACANGVLFFSANGRRSGVELWKTDGTKAGTVLVKDLIPGSTSSSPIELTGVGSRVYFQGNDGKVKGLWVSDGTTAGTRRICPKLTFPKNLALCGCKLLFSAFSAATSHELWAIDAPGATVRRFGNPCSPQKPSMDATLPILGKTMRFSGDHGPRGNLGLLLLDLAPRSPTKLPGGCLGLVHPLLILGAVPPPKWVMQVPLPKDQSLNGLCLAAQTWWIQIGSVVPIQTSNGVLLGLGG